MANSTTFVGIDAHKKTLYATISYPDHHKESFEIPNNERSVRRFARKLHKNSTGPVSACYEAGPCGYVLQRQLRNEGIDCAIIAPSLIPKKPGERIKTDRRDSQMLVDLFKADLLTEVYPPTLQDESVRELCRAREDAKDTTKRAKQRMGKFLLRKGIRYTEGKHSWTQRYMQWLSKLSFEHKGDQMAFTHRLITVNQALEREEEITYKIQEISRQEPYRVPVGWLSCLHGVSTISAMTIVSELHNFVRFESPRQLMSYLGLTPSEHSSGSSKSRGSITKAGNARVRRVLTEAAWNYRWRPTTGKTVRDRRKDQPGWVVAIANKAQNRLYNRHLKLQRENKNTNKITVAIARELAGFVWAILRNPENPLLKLEM